MSGDRIEPQELFQRVLDAYQRSQSGPTPVRMQGYNRETQTADVEQVIRPDGEEQAMLPGRAVMALGGGGSYLVFPHAPGDTGLAIPCQTEIGAWRRSGDVGPPADEGRGGMSGAVVLPGLRTEGDAVAAPAGATVLAGDDVRLGADPDTNIAAVHEQALAALDALLSDWDAFLVGLDAWATSVGAAQVPPIPWPVPGPQPLLTALRAEIATVQAGIAAGDYKSPSVYVEE